MFPIGVDTFKRFNNNLEIIRVEELIRKAPLDRNITNTHLLAVCQSLQTFMSNSSLLHGPNSSLRHGPTISLYNRRILLSPIANTPMHLRCQIKDKFENVWRI